MKNIIFNTIFICIFIISKSYAYKPTIPSFEHDPMHPLYIDKNFKPKEDIDKSKKYNLQKKFLAKNNKEFKKLNKDIEQVKKTIKKEENTNYYILNKILDSIINIEYKLANIQMKNEKKIAELENKIEFLSSQIDIELALNE